MNRRFFLKGLASTSVLALLPEVVLALQSPVILIGETIVTDKTIVITEGSFIQNCYIDYIGNDCAIRIPKEVKDYKIINNIIVSHGAYGIINASSN